MFTDKRYSWSIPSDELPQETDNYTVHIEMDLGSKFYRQGLIIKVKFSAFVANCFHWNDLELEWQTDKCKVKAGYCVVHCSRWLLLIFVMLLLYRIFL